jgi:hypothetical protein
MMREIVKVLFATKKSIGYTFRACPDWMAKNINEA